MNNHYAQWEYYKESYKGIVIVSQEKFEQVINKAQAFIDDITANRAADYFTHTPTPIKQATCAVAEEFYRAQVAEENLNRLLMSEQGVIVQESVDGFQVTYAKPFDPNTNEGQKETRRKAFVAARVYLRWTGLLYTGVSVP